MNWWQWVLVGTAIWLVAVLPLSVVLGAFVGMTSHHLYPDPWDVADADENDELGTLLTFPGSRGTL